MFVVKTKRSLKKNLSGLRPELGIIEIKVK